MLTNVRQRLVSLLSARENVLTWAAGAKRRRKSASSTKVTSRTTRCLPPWRVGCSLVQPTRAERAIRLASRCAKSASKRSNRAAVKPSPSPMKCSRWHAALCFLKSQHIGQLKGGTHVGDEDHKPKRATQVIPPALYDRWPLAQCRLVMKRDNGQCVVDGCGGAMR